MTASTKTAAGMGRATYNDALKDARTAASLAEYESALEKANEAYSKNVALIRDLRELHVTHQGATSVDTVARAIGDVQYNLKYAKNDITSYEQRIAQLKGETAVEDDDE